MKNAKIALALGLLVAATTTAVHSRTLSLGKTRTGTAARPTVQVTVPGSASGAFGNPADQAVPFVPAITVSGPGTITVTYVSGTVNGGFGEDLGPNGTSCGPPNGTQYPLREARGVSDARTCNVCALIGVFVPQSRVEDPRGFNALDGTKNLTRVGIKPDGIFFIGEGKTFDVKEAGTLFLGINDNIVGDNSGGFTVEVTGP